ncbi:MAG: GNAT family N-acetyltransferase [Actinomycetes bacterium]
MLPAVRVADPARDAESCADIYGHYVEHSVTTFEFEPPTVREMAVRIGASLATHEWLVADRDNVVDGFAYAKPWNPRPAYDWSCETAIYVRAGSEGGGVGTALYDGLLARLRSRGFYVAIGRIALPNPASVRLHESFGYIPVGVHRNLGYKHGQWIDVMHTALQLNAATGEPSPVRGR